MCIRDSSRPGQSNYGKSLVFFFRGGKAPASIAVMDFALTQAREDAAAILASAPSVLAKAAAFVTGEGPEPQIDWAKIAYLASQNVLSSGDRAFLGICAEIAGFNPDVRQPDQTFGARWDSLDGQHQSVIASVLTQSCLLYTSRCV